MESDLTGWERLSGIIHLLWAHNHNAHVNPVCPFCDSHGNEEILGSNGPCQLFRRNCDDKLVIHFETSCRMHEREIEWAVHVPALEFLCDFGRMPANEIEKLWCEASPYAPWEKRFTRMATLCEMVKAGARIRSKELVAAIEDHA